MTVRFKQRLTTRPPYSDNLEYWSAAEIFLLFQQEQIGKRYRYADQQTVNISPFSWRYFSIHTFTRWHQKGGFASLFAVKSCNPSLRRGGLIQSALTTSNIYYLGSLTSSDSRLATVPICFIIFRLNSSDNLLPQTVFLAFSKFEEVRADCTSA